MIGAELKSSLKAEAERLGFSLFGVAPANDADGFRRFEDWLDHDYHGSMMYLQLRRDARRNPISILASVRSVVMLGYEYPTEAVENPANHGRVAAYARGPDYHDWIRERLHQLGDWLRQQAADVMTRGVTDSAPLLERDFARRAGLGWFGKNTMLINKQRGSFFFLAALLTNLELPPDQPTLKHHCGTCTACLTACPTQAFPEPGVLDARKCISYLTIETKNSFPIELRGGVGDWLFGCDICQDVCPWNRHSTKRVLSTPHDSELASLNAVAILDMTETEFRLKFRSTPLSRPRWNGLRRNAAIVLGNHGDREALPALERAILDPDAVVQDAARWAKAMILKRFPGDS